MTFHVVDGNYRDVPEIGECFCKVNADPEGGFESWATRDGNESDRWHAVLFVERDELVSESFFSVEHFVELFFL